jgi:uncharacterized protein (TIGR03437 family)
MTAAQGTVSVAATEPGVFSMDSSGTGQAIVINQDGSFNSKTNPANQNSIVTLFATGAGVMQNPALTDGEVVPPAPPIPTSQPAASVRLTVCGVDINASSSSIRYKGPIPGEIAGVLQVNFVVPSCKNTGSAVPLVLYVGGGGSQTGLTIAIQ